MSGLLLLGLLSYAQIPSLFTVRQVDVADLHFKVPASTEKVFYYKFAPGDTIVLDAEVVSGKDISEITVGEWPSSIKFQTVAVKRISREFVVGPSVSVYFFKFKNSAMFSDKIYRIRIQRIPANQDFAQFNTTVEWDTVADTTWVAVKETLVVSSETVPEELINTQVKLGSQLSGNRRSYVEIAFPEGTTYWVYWIGVGEESAAGLEAMSRQLPEAATLLGIVNPVSAFAIGLIPELFSSPTGSDVSYYLIQDYQNLMRFLRGEAFYFLKEGQRIITDYAKMEKPTTGNIYLALDNIYSVMTPKIVTVRVVTVRTQERYEVREVQKPQVNLRLIPRLSQ